MNTVSDEEQDKKIISRLYPCLVKGIQYPKGEKQQPQPLKLQLVQRRKTVFGKAGGCCHCERILTGSWSIVYKNNSDDDDTVDDNPQPFGPNLYIQGNKEKPGGKLLSNETLTLRNSQGHPLAVARQNHARNREAFQLYVVGEPLFAGQAVSNKPYMDEETGQGPYNLFTLGIIQNPRILLNRDRHLTLPVNDTTTHVLTIRRIGGLLKGEWHVLWDNDAVVATVKLGRNWKGPVIYNVTIPDPHAVDPCLVLLTLATDDRLGELSSRRNWWTRQQKSKTKRILQQEKGSVWSFFLV